MPVPSIGETITQAIVDALKAPDDKPCMTYRSRMDAVAAKELPVLIVYGVKEVPQRKGPTIYLRTRTVRVEAMVEGEAPADSLTDALYVFVVNTLLGDAALAGQIRKLWQSTVEWDTMQSYEDRCIAFMDFDVEFVTKEDPTVRVDT